VAGGDTRVVVVRNGLDAATGEIVVVHDGARPLVTVDEITRTVEKAMATGAACLVAAVTDTIKEADGRRHHPHRRPQQVKACIDAAGISATLF
jgi:2-C-methyl-D-erythritol 4-phosphate cytidylyltransferase